MTNGTVGATVTGVSGPVITVKYKGGEQKIVVSPDTPIVKYVIGDAGDLKPGAKFAVNCGAQAAGRQLQRQPHQRRAIAAGRLCPPIGTAIALKLGR